MNGFRLNFRNSIQMTQETIGHLLVKNRKRFQIFKILQRISGTERNNIIHK